VFNCDQLRLKNCLLPANRCKRFPLPAAYDGTDLFGVK
jgi:hypothetical protein